MRVAKLKSKKPWLRRKFGFARLGRVMAAQVYQTANHPGFIRRFLEKNES